MQENIILDIYNKEKLKSAGWTDEEIFKRIVEIDTNNDLNEETTGNEERLMGVFNSNPGLWRIFIYNNKIIGYWNCVPLNKEYLDRVEKGLLHERDINANNLKKDIYSEVTDLLFDSVCLDKPYQGKKLSYTVISSIYDAFCDLMKEGCKFGKIWASIWSEDGIRFFTNLGFKEFRENKYIGKIYYVEYPEFFNRLKSIKQATIIKG